AMLGRAPPRGISPPPALLPSCWGPRRRIPPNPPGGGAPPPIPFPPGRCFLLWRVSVPGVGAGFPPARGVLRALCARCGRALGAAGGFVVVIATAIWLLPAINEVPAQFPAVVLWRFRVASLGIELILWTVIGLLFGALTERSLAAGYRGRPRPALS